MFIMSWDATISVFHAVRSYNAFSLPIARAFWWLFNVYLAHYA